MTVPFVDRDFHCIPNCKMAEQNGECLTRCLVKRAKPDSPVTQAMVDRFLSWKLPEDFHPDAGISFSPYFNVEYNAKHGKPPQRHEPIGTNLLTATQARAMLEHVLACVPTEALSSWVPVTERLPEGKTGVPYMTFMTGPVLVLHSDRPDYPITAHASLGDDLDTLGVRIPTNGASKYRWISWYAQPGCDAVNPFGLKDQDYNRFLPRIFGSKITHWMPLPTCAVSPLERRSVAEVYCAKCGQFAGGPIRCCNDFDGIECGPEEANRIRAAKQSTPQHSSRQEKP